jgi:hypothetical protein
MTDRTAAFTAEDALAELAQAQLGHQRRTDRLVDSARRISQHEDAGAARRRVGFSERRPQGEEDHKAQKTGLGVEPLQLPSQAGLPPLLALRSVLAVPLVNARQAARVPEKADRPATAYFDPLWVEVLSRWRYQEGRDLTVKEFVLALGRLGGHRNRQCDGLPGWLTLWRGLRQLNAMVEYELARRGAGAGTRDPAPPSPELSSPSCGTP